MDARPSHSPSSTSPSIAAPRKRRAALRNSGKLTLQALWERSKRLGSAGTSGESALEPSARPRHPPLLGATMRALGARQANMATDGDMAYSGFTAEQIADALINIDKAAYMLNIQFDADPGARFS
jgi:hypothetical protein